MRPDELRLMCVLAHPDDESLGTGGTLALCAREGIATYVVTATRGERGRFKDATASPGPDVIGRTRETARSIAWMPAKRRRRLRPKSVASDRTSSSPSVPMGPTGIRITSP